MTNKQLLFAPDLSSSSLSLTSSTLAPLLCVRSSLSSPRSYIFRTSSGMPCRSKKLISDNKSADAGQFSRISFNHWIGLVVENTDRCPGELIQKRLTTHLKQMLAEVPVSVLVLVSREHKQKAELALRSVTRTELFAFCWWVEQGRNTFLLTV